MSPYQVQLRKFFFFVVYFVSIVVRSNNQMTSNLKKRPVISNSFFSAALFPVVNELFYIMNLHNNNYAKTTFQFEIFILQFSYDSCLCKQLFEKIVRIVSRINNDLILISHNYHMKCNDHKNIIERLWCLDKSCPTKKVMCTVCTCTRICCICCLSLVMIFLPPLTTLKVVSSLKSWIFYFI